MGSLRNCVVFGCSMNYRKASAMNLSVQFYSFPTRTWMVERRKIWIRFVKRMGPNGKPWVPSKSSLICSQHFIGGMKSEDPRSPSFNPTIFKVTSIECARPTGSKDRYHRLLNRNKTRPTKVDQNNQITEHQVNVHCHGGQPPETQANTLASHGIESIPANTIDDGSITDCAENFERNNEVLGVSCQTTFHEHQRDKCAGPDSRSVYFGGFSTINIKGGLRHMTGVSENIFAVFRSLFPNHMTRHRELGLDDKLLLTLFKIKTGLTFRCIGIIFGVSTSVASSIFCKFVRHLKSTTQSWIFLPNQQAVRDTLPESFKEHYSNCRLIIDCTEFRTQVPPSVEQRVQMYSNYKSAYTAKYLIGITPGGLIAFLSKGYGGRATDSFISNDCGFIGLLNEGDIVLADKGFPSVQVNDGVILVMPPFSKRNQSQFSEEDMQLTYEVARVRIHVERAIQRIKSFEMLSKIVCIDMIPLLDDIIHLVGVLVNLSSPIIKK